MSVFSKYKQNNESSSQYYFQEIMSGKSVNRPDKYSRTELLSGASGSSTGTVTTTTIRKRKLKAAQQ